MLLEFLVSAAAKIMGGYCVLHWPIPRRWRARFHSYQSHTAQQSRTALSTIVPPPESVKTFLGYVNTHKNGEAPRPFEVALQVRGMTTPPLRGTPQVRGMTTPPLRGTPPREGNAERKAKLCRRVRSQMKFGNEGKWVGELYGLLSSGFRCIGRRLRQQVFQ